jgi:phosphoribosylamine--glycine ligase
MKILLIGSGAREHAIACAITRSPQRPELHCFASSCNPGIQQLANQYSVGKITDVDSTVRLATQWQSELAIIGPEAPLESGIADALWLSGIPTVGPKKRLAQLETSKSFTRKLLDKYLPQACPRFRSFNSLDGVREFLRDLGDRYVIKVDGLMRGKGVKVAGDHLHSHTDALTWCETLIARQTHFLIEEKLEGEEFSLMSFCDGKHLVHLPPVQDHKRAYENDEGPNTGGMGSYSDANHLLPFLKTVELEEAWKINETVARALHTEFNEGYKGIIYGGLMITSTGIKVIEYNARFGDPEALNILSILESDFVAILQAVVRGNLNPDLVKIAKKATVCKYAVPEGYPNNPIKNQKIDISQVMENKQLYLASVDARADGIYEVGSRTAAFVGIADSLKAAEHQAEAEISSIQGPLFHRKDIGTPALIQKRTEHMRTLRSYLQKQR